MKFIVDNQLPPALARLIQNELGSGAVHVADVGLRDASDSQVWEYASVNDFVLISKDEDFVAMYIVRPTAGFVWVRIGNCRRGFLLEAFRRAWPKIRERLENGEGFVEVR